MVDVEDDNDDLWDFSTPGGAEIIPQSESGSDDDDDIDGLRALPASKRRKLQKKLIVVPDLVVLDDSSGSDEPDPDLEIVEEIRRKNEAKQAERAEEIEFLDLTNIAPLSGSGQNGKFDTAQANIQHNLERLREVKAMLHAEMLEPPEPYEMPALSQQQIEDAAEEGADLQVEPELDKIIVKVQAKSKDAPVKLRIGKRNTLDKLFAAFTKRAEELEWLSAGTPIKFMFDGEVIRSEDTPEDLDIEEDCVIEAHWQDGL